MSQLSRINKKNTRHKFKSQRAPFSAIIIHINNLIARSLSLYGTEPILCQTKKKKKKKRKKNNRSHDKNTKDKKERTGSSSRVEITSKCSLPDSRWSFIIERESVPRFRSWYN